MRLRRADFGFLDFLMELDDRSAAAFLPLTLWRSASIRSTTFDGRSSFLGRLDGLAGRLALDQLAQRQLELVLELRGIEVAGLGVEDMRGEADHLLGDPGWRTCP